MNCTCDYDSQGDPLRFVRISRHCTVHDMCDGCDARPGAVVVEDEWLCRECAETEGMDK